MLEEVGQCSKVVLRGLAFHARHGVFVEEAVLGARFLIDAELYYPFEESDNLESAVNYAAAYSLIERLVTAERFDLIETLALRLCRELLASFAPLKAARVRVHKPHAPLPGIFDDVYAECFRARP